MSATARRHRRAAGSYRATQALRQAAGKPVVSLGTSGPYEALRQGDVMFMLARPMPGMAPELAAAIRLRRDATITGTCPSCGARRHGGPPRPGHPASAFFMHDEDCPAGDRAIDELVERTGWTGTA